MSGFRRGGLPGALLGRLKSRNRLKINKLRRWHNACCFCWNGPAFSRSEAGSQESRERAVQSKRRGGPANGGGYGLQNYRFTMHELQHVRIRMSQCGHLDEGRYICDRSEEMHGMRRQLRSAKMRRGMPGPQHLRSSLKQCQPVPKAVRISAEQGQRGSS